MNDEIDQHLEMQDTNSMLMQQFGNESESQEEGMSPYQFSENFELASPNRRSRKKEKIIEKLLSNRGKFNEKASLFNLINSLQLVWLLEKNRQQLYII
ncbi:unnamed protein product [Paramecium sonneborni]|uniref:Uncharacterized protein n=1 Tax=Paramecium sonneborni TaxID=65129 RepID=A0A8S1R3H5_9CILI|nr:unnamed protein product [Paramecium sonneborni]